MPAETPTPAERQTILVIDDDINLAAIFAAGLEAGGYRALHAPNAATGLKLAREHLPDLILCDIEMPGRDGRRLLQDLRADPVLADRQFVLMTGKTDLYSQRAAMDLGADDFLAKPISLTDLLACVSARLHRAENRRRPDEPAIAQLRTRLQSTLPQEFFEPLASILGLTELLEGDFESLPAEDVRADLHDIRMSARRLHRTLRNHLLMLEIAALDRVPPRDPIGAEAVVRALAAGVQSAAESRRRETDVTAALIGAPLCADQVALTSLAEELVDNALQFSSAGSPVQVRSWLDGALWHFEVTDAGCGMTPGQLEHWSRPPAGGRTPVRPGPGLPIVSRIAHHLGGQLHLGSEAGKGTVGRVTLPVAT